MAGSNALKKSRASSNATTPAPQISRAQSPSPASGRAYQISPAHRLVTSVPAATPRFAPPSRSARAPISGLRIAMITPVTAIMKLQSALPVTGSTANALA